MVIELYNIRTSDAFTHKNYNIEMSYINLITIHETSQFNSNYCKRLLVKNYEYMYMLSCDILFLNYSMNLCRLVAKRSYRKMYPGHRGTFLQVPGDKFFRRLFGGLRKNCEVLLLRFLGLLFAKGMFFLAG